MDFGRSSSEPHFDEHIRSAIAKSVENESCSWSPTESEQHRSIGYAGYQTCVHAPLIPMLDHIIRKQVSVVGPRKTGTYGRIVTIGSVGVKLDSGEIMAFSQSETVCGQKEVKETADIVIGIVAYHYGIEPCLIRQDDRRYVVAMARHVAILVTKKIRGATLTELAAAFNRRDHSTIASSLKVSGNYLAGDKKPRIRALLKQCQLAVSQ